MSKSRARYLSELLNSTGEINATLGVALGDNDVATFGDSDDLQILHDGSNSYIKDVGTGSLRIAGSQVILRNAADSAHMFRADDGGAVGLYHNSSSKLETSSTGITVTGNIANSSGDMTLDVAGDIILDADGGDIKLKDGSTHWASLYTNGTNTYLQNMVNSGDVYLSGKDGSGNGVNALILDMSAGGNATFSGNITFGDSHTIGNDADDNLAIASSAGENLIIDSADDIILDADGGDVYFKDGGSTIAIAKMNSSNFTLQTNYNDKDIIFKGYDSDGGGLITALTLDMSAAGAATFNSQVTIPTIAYVGQSIVHQGDSDTSIDFAGANDLRIYAAGLEHATFDGTIVFNQGGANMDLRVESSGNQNMLMVDAGNDRVAIGHNAPTETLHVEGAVRISNNSADTYFGYGSNSDNYISTASGGATIFRQLGTERMRLASNGRLGLGTSSPRYELSVAGNNATAMGIAVDNANGSGTLDIAVLGSSYNSHQAGAGEVWFYSPDNINIGGATGNTNDIKFLSNNSVNMIVKGDTGRVAVGHNAPTARLDIKGAGGGTGLTFKTTDASSNETFFIQDGGRAGVRYYPLTVGIPSGTSAASGALFQVEEAGHLFVNTSGNVGIGTINPYYKFDVYGANLSNGEAKNLALFFDTSSGTTGTGAGIAFGGYTNGTSGPINHLGNIQGIKENSTAGNYASALLFSTRANGATPLEQMRISSAGNVGIGTSSPYSGTGVTSLTINATSYPVLALRAGDTNYGIVNATSTYLNVGTIGSRHIRFTPNDTERLRISATAAELQIGGTTNAGFIDFDGTSLQLNTQRNPNTGSFVNTGRSHAGITLRGADGSSEIRFYTTNSNNSTGVERVRIADDGKVAIGHGFTPLTHLHVNKGSSGYQPASNVEKNYVAINTDYDAVGRQGIYFSHLTGNHIDGSSGVDSQYGMLFGYQNSVRGGLIYDHRGTEMMSIWSSYGPIRFMTPNSADGDGVPNDSNISDRLHIEVGGNVGIGTNNPSAPLEVRGSMLINDPDDGGAPAMTATLHMYGYEGRGVGLKLRDNTNSASGATDREWFVGTGYSQSNFNIGYAADGAQSSYAAQNKLTITTAGNVGIGTAGPDSKLHVSDATNISASAGGAGQFAVEGNGYTTSIAMDATRAHIYHNSSLRNLSFGTDESIDMTIKGSNGFVGIGIESPLDLLHIKSSTTDARQIIDGHTGFDAELKFAENGSVKYTIGHDAATDNFVIGTANVDSEQRLIINSAGNVGIGTTAVNLNSTDIALQVGSGSYNNPAIQIRSSSTGTGRLWFGDNSGSDDGRADGYIQYEQGNRAMKFGTAQALRMSIDQYGQFAVRFNDTINALVIGGPNTVNGVTATPSNSGTVMALGRDTGSNRSAHFAGFLKFDSGYGIDFGSTSNASGMTSSVLDDYEEGTWTATTSGGISVTTTNGTYTKIGRLVFLNADLTVATGSTSGSNLIFTGLPFAGAETFSTGSINFTNLGSSFDDASINYDTGNGGVTVRSSYNGATVTYGQFAGKRIIFNLMYHTSS